MAKNNKDRLPLTRIEQIWYLLKNEVWVLFLVNFICFLFIIPTILVFFFGVTTFHTYAIDSSKTNMDIFNVWIVTNPFFIFIWYRYDGINEHH